MLLGYFSDEAYDMLLNDIDKNSENYLKNEDWLPEYFGYRNDYFKQSKSVEVNDFTPFITPGEKSESQKSKDDLTNVRLMYDAFKNLTPLQASNKYMWTYLCHAIPKYREYIMDRWLTNERTNTIKTRFFVTGSDSLRNDNALSRLWWYGYLTYDETNPNHYALTEILLMNQTICTDVMDTLNRTNFNRIKGVLTAIKDFNNELDEREGITDYFRECKKYLNHFAAVSNLDFLSAEEIHDLAFNYMIGLRQSKKKN